MQHTAMEAVWPSPKAFSSITQRALQVFCIHRADRQRQDRSVGAPYLAHRLRKLFVRCQLCAAQVVARRVPMLGAAGARPACHRCAVAAIRSIARGAVGRRWLRGAVGSCRTVAMAAVATALSLRQLGGVFVAVLTLLLQQAAGAFDAGVDLGALLRPHLPGMKWQGTAGQSCALAGSSAHRLASQAPRQALQPHSVCVPFTTHQAAEAEVDSLRNRQLRQVNAWLAARQVQAKSRLLLGRMNHNNTAAAAAHCSAARLTSDKWLPCCFTRPAVCRKCGAARQDVCEPGGHETSTHTRPTDTCTACSACLGAQQT